MKSGAFAPHSLESGQSAAADSPRWL